MVLTDDPPLYRDLMRLKPEELTPNAWAVKAGVSRTVWTDMRRHGNPSRRTLERLLAAAGSSLAEFEALRIGDAPYFQHRDGPVVGDASAAPWRAAPLPPLPLYATASVGEWGNDGRGIGISELDAGKVVGRLDRPASLAGDRQAYGVTVAEGSMWPRFRLGRQLLVSPAAAIATGDDVLVRLAGEATKPKILVKELVRRSASTVELRQFDPEAAFEVDASAIAAIHKVIGEAV
jgi:phage repressor protein C with HTH and peptisase S24 domain